jgi:hypothetical protein
LKFTRRELLWLAAGAGSAGWLRGGPAPLFEEIPPSASGIDFVHDSAMSQRRHLPETMGPGAAFLDYDNDGWMDLYLVNAGPCDFYTPPKTVRNALYKNNRDGTFTDVTLKAGVPGGTFGMGAAVGDYDNDGWPDIFVNSLANQRYALFHNLKGAFLYVSSPSGLGPATFAHSGWGAHFVDFDNDGWKDLFVGQGHVMDNIELTQPYLHYLEPPLLLRNLKGRFEDVSAGSGAIFRRPMAARGVAFGDLYNDGSIDLAINCDDGDAVIARNRGSANHWLTVDTEGTRSNRDGIGAVLHLVSETGQEQYVMVSTAGSYLSASDKRAHFGLGAAKMVRRLEIRWPSGTLQTLTNISSDRILHVREPVAPVRQK